LIILRTSSEKDELACEDYLAIAIAFVLVQIMAIAERKNLERKFADGLPRISREAFPI
jgi:hypothetical protein